MPIRRDSHVMASSYGPFYGVLDAVGKILSRFDAASYREYFYDLTTGPAGMAFRPTEATHAAAVKSLRAAIAAITRFYNVPVPLR